MPYHNWIEVYTCDKCGLSKEIKCQRENKLFHKLHKKVCVPLPEEERTERKNKAIKQIADKLDLQKQGNPCARASKRRAKKFGEGGELSQLEIKDDGNIEFKPT